MPMYALCSLRKRCRRGRRLSRGADEDEDFQEVPTRTKTFKRCRRGRRGADEDEDLSLKEWHDISAKSVPAVARTFATDDCSENPTDIHVLANLRFLLTFDSS
jgi:hypothetical protein